MDIATIFWAGHALAVAVGGATGFYGLRKASADAEQVLIDGLLEMQENEFQTISSDDPDVQLESGKFHVNCGHLDDAESAEFISRTRSSLEELPFQLMRHGK